MQSRVCTTCEQRRKLARASQDCRKMQGGALHVKHRDGRELWRKQEERTVSFGKTAAPPDSSGLFLELLETQKFSPT